MTKSITLNYVAAAVLAVAMTFAFVTPAFAAMNSSEINITTTNQGEINNLTSSISATGLNLAGGSAGGVGGVGGGVHGGTGDFNNGGADAGNGGDGGAGSEGGLVETGDSVAIAGTENGLNGTDVDVQVPTDMNSSRARVNTDNDDDTNTINNATSALGGSAGNAAAGSTGGDAGDAGQVTSDGDNNNGAAASGDGGEGGMGGIGGTVRTGASRSEAGSINLLNTTIIRVRN